MFRPKVALTGIALVVWLTTLHLPAGAQTSGTWVVTGSLNTPSGSHTATLLSNGQVLVAGGTNASVFLSSAELYNPATGKWTITGSMTTARAEHSATLLPNGEVLVAGGTNTTGLRLPPGVTQTVKTQLAVR